jgi:hypothetical protein
MNVIFHTLGSLATAAVLSAKPDEKKWNLKKLSIGFIAGILLHGILDVLPHNYPLPSKFDAAASLLLLALSILLAQSRNRILILVCFAGAVFPDIVDLGAGIINKHLGIPVPQMPFKIFPWHRKQYSGSVYDGSRNIESLACYIFLLSICFCLIYVFRKRFLAVSRNLDPEKITSK